MGDVVRHLKLSIGRDGTRCRTEAGLSGNGGCLRSSNTAAIKEGVAARIGVARSCRCQGIAAVGVSQQGVARGGAHLQGGVLIVSVGLAVAQCYGIGVGSQIDAGVTDVGASQELPLVSVRDGAGLRCREDAAAFSIQRSVVVNPLAVTTQRNRQPRAFQQQVVVGIVSLVVGVADIHGICATVQTSFSKRASYLVFTGCSLCTFCNAVIAGIVHRLFIIYCRFPIILEVRGQRTHEVLGYAGIELATGLVAQ